MRPDMDLESGLRGVLASRNSVGQECSTTILRIEPRTGNSGAANDEKQEQDWQVNQAAPDFADFSRYSAGSRGLQALIDNGLS